MRLKVYHLKEDIAYCNKQNKKIVILSSILFFCFGAIIFASTIDSLLREGFDFYLSIGLLFGLIVGIGTPIIIHRWGKEEKYEEYSEIECEKFEVVKK